MSFWILTYNNINKPYYTGPVGLYETQDEAVEASIIHFCGNGLSETPDGKIWFQSCESIGLPIERPQETHQKGRYPRHGKYME